MKNKKHLAWLIAGNNLKGTFTSHSFLIEKLCEKFEKIYLINLLNLRYFPDYVIKKKEFNDKIDKKFKIPKNFEIFYPKTKKEFEDNKSQESKKMYNIQDSAEDDREEKSEEESDESEEEWE